jgi:hypothetical protein
MNRACVGLQIVAVKLLAPLGSAKKLRLNSRYSCLPGTRAGCVRTLIPLYIRTHTLRAYKLCDPIGLLVDAVVIQVEH